MQWIGSVLARTEHRTLAVIRQLLDAFARLRPRYSSFSHLMSCCYPPTPSSSLLGMTLPSYIYVDVPSPCRRWSEPSDFRSSSFKMPKKPRRSFGSDGGGGGGAAPGLDLLHLDHSPRMPTRTRDGCEDPWSTAAASDPLSLSPPQESTVRMPRRPARTLSLELAAGADSPGT
jgi:hypothetical protein